MGYGTEVKIVYGFELDELQAKQLVDMIDNETPEDMVLATPESDLIYRKCGNPSVAGQESTWAGHGQTQPKYPYSVFDLCMDSADTDSRIHSTMYEKGFRHFFGIEVGTQGYGGVDNVSVLAKEAISNQTFLNDRLNKLGASIIAQLNLVDQPDIHIFSRYI